jgi:hypothetical protein
MPDPDLVRDAINAIADCKAVDPHREILTGFIAREIYRRLRPSTRNGTAGDVYHWLTEHGYSDKQLKPWLFNEGRVYGYAILIAQALEHGQCGCPGLAFSHRSQTEALKRCRKRHFLNRMNLDEFVQTADQRVKHSEMQWSDKSEVHVAKAHMFQSDVLTFVRWAVHGITRVSTGEREFGQSMLAWILDTPIGTQLRIKPWESAAGKKTYRLYDTRDGIVGSWLVHSVSCEECNLVATSPTSLMKCEHKVDIKSQVSNAVPSGAFSLELARCRNCGEHWPWRQQLEKCPRCGGRRRKIQIEHVI